MCFNLISRFFFGKVGKVGKYDGKREYFEERTLPFFEKASLTMLEGAKYPGGSRVSCC